MFLTPKRNFHLDEERKRYNFDALGGEIQPRVIVFREPPGKTSFLSVRIIDEGREHIAGGNTLGYLLNHGLAGRRNLNWCYTGKVYLSDAWCRTQDTEEY